MNLFQYVTVSTVDEREAHVPEAEKDASRTSVTTTKNELLPIGDMSTDQRRGDNPTKTDSVLKNNPLLGRILAHKKAKDKLAGRASSPLIDVPRESTPSKSNIKLPSTESPVKSHGEEAKTEPTFRK